MLNKTTVSVGEGHIYRFIIYDQRLYLVETDRSTLLFKSLDLFLRVTSVTPAASAAISPETALPRTNFLS
jgi:hypothetical protein